MVGIRQIRKFSGWSKWFSATDNLSQKVARIASGVTILVGCLVLIGWSFDISWLKSVLPGTATMKANTALCFVLAGISLRSPTRLAKGCAIAVGAIGLAMLCQYLLDWNLGIDELLFSDPISPATSHPGRMGANTALNFTLIGLALGLRENRNRYSDAIVQTVTICTAAIALLAVIGYAYGVQVFYEFVFYSTSMAIHTALTFLVLSIGILASQTDYQIVKLLTQDLSGSVAVRQLLPIAIALPFGLGWLILQGWRAKFYDAGFSLALFAISLILTLALVLYQTASRLNRIDRARHRSSERLRSSEAQNLMATEAAELGMWFWNIPNNELIWTDRCKVLFGLSPDTQMSYEVFLQALHPEDRDRADAAVTRSLNEKVEYNIEYRTVWSDGSERWILAKGRGFYDTNGQPIQMMGTAQDITAAKRLEAERQQAQADLQERTEHIRLLYETTRDLLSTDRPIHLVDTIFKNLKQAIGLDVYFNYLLDEDSQKLHLVFYGGISEETAKAIEWLEIGRAICGTVAERRQQIVQPNLQECIDPKAELVKSLGLNAYSCQPLIAQGKLFGTLGFGSYSRKEFTIAETKLFQVLCDQIAIALDRAELFASLQQQTQELIRTNRLKDEFLAALFHELRTPLNPILGWTKMMQRKKLNPVKTTEALDIIERNVKQQISLVDDLLDMSGAIQGKVKLDLQSVDLASILQQAIQTVEFAAQGKGIAIEYTGLSSLKIMGDGDRLQQVFWNLLANAIKFTPENGRVEVNLSVDNRNVRVGIADNGIGIAPEFISHVFDRFRQADGSSTRKYGGLGLGLAIVRHFVELHGGTVTAESPGIDRGTTFTVWLPLQPETETLPPSSPESMSADTPTAITGKHILLVEDDPDNLELLRFLLEYYGAIVTAIASPLDALDAIVRDSIDLIISDIGMPKLNGYEFLRQVRALPQGERIPAVALTAFAQEEDQDSAIAAGFQAHISKPLDPLELLAGLTKLLEG